MREGAVAEGASHHAPAGRRRLVSVDALRGATIAAMILVNNPGRWGEKYQWWPLRHAEWHGWTPTDLVFPFFLFVVGVAITLALGRRVDEGRAPGEVVPKILRRTALLFGFGLLLSFASLFSWQEGGVQFAGLSQLRIPGVLQRIAVCYCAAALLFLYTSPRTQLRVLVGCLLVYWPLITLVPVPGQEMPDIDQRATHLGAWLDRFLLGGGHLWVKDTFDPEGILSTVPALATTLLGVSAGRVLRSDRTESDKVLHLLLRGTVLTAVGWVWGWFFPINKPLWTSSYAVFTGGLAMCALALCHWTFDVRAGDVRAGDVRAGDVRDRQALAKPLVIYGVNALTVFVMSGLVGRALVVLRAPGGELSLKDAIYSLLLASWAPPAVASFLYACLWILCWFGVLAWMYRRGIVLKV